QKDSLTPSCTALPPPAPLSPVPLPTVEVTYPKVELVRLPLGLSNSGVFVRLNVSPRNSRLTRSLILKFLNSERFNANRPGPLRMFRPVLPKTTPVGCAKLEVENHGLP